MRPVPIPAELVPEGCTTRVLAAPDGDLLNPDIRPVEALLDQRTGLLTSSVRLTLEPGELEALAGGGHVWLTVQGRLPVFAIQVTD